jgi:hypothetical protein
VIFAFVAWWYTPVRAPEARPAAAS